MWPLLPILSVKALAHKSEEKHAEPLKKQQTCAENTWEKAKQQWMRTIFYWCIWKNLDYIQITSTTWGWAPRTPLMQQGSCSSIRVTKRFINHICEDIRD